MRRRRRVGNPLIAVIVSLVVAGMGSYVFIESSEGNTRLYGAALILMGVFGATANLVLRAHYRREDQQAGQRRRR